MDKLPVPDVVSGKKEYQVSPDNYEAARRHIEDCGEQDTAEE